jgi:hypothetical protein
VKYPNAEYHLHESGIQKALRAATLTAGMPKRVSPMRCGTPSRHTCAMREGFLGALQDGKFTPGEALYP